MRRFHLPKPDRLWTIGPAALGLVMACITALGISGVSEAESKMLSEQVREVVAPQRLEEQTAALSAHGLDLTREDEIRSNDSIAGLLDRLGVSDPAALGYLGKDRRTQAVLRSNTGQTVVVRTDLEGRLLRLQMLNKLDAWIVERIGEGQFETKTARFGSELQIEHRSVQVSR
jgi:hypothetical protein